MKFRLFSSLAFVVLLFAGCASTDYSTFEGSKVYHGAGGAKKVVNGIEIWTDGEPPRDFRIIGIITDNRATGLAQNMTYFYDIARKVKNVGGDAAIIMSSRVDVVGTTYTQPYVNGTTRQTTYGSDGKASGYTTGFTYSAPQAVVQREKSSKIAVIRYVE